MSSDPTSNMNAGNCVSCNEPFVKGPKGYTRFTLAKLTTLCTAEKCFPNLRSFDGFICNECRKLLYSLTFLHKQTKKREWISLPDEETFSPSFSQLSQLNLVKEEDPFIKNEVTQEDFNTQQMKWTDMNAPTQKGYRFKKIEDRTFRERACVYLNNSKYLKCFRTLLTNSESARSALITVACTEIRKEVKRVSQLHSKMDITSLVQDNSDEDAGSVDWERVVEECKNKLPVLYNCLDAAFPSSQKFRRVGTVSMEDAIAKRNARLGTSISVILYSAHPTKNHRAQSAMSEQLWFDGASQKVFSYLNYLGMCRSRRATHRVHFNMATQSRQKDRERAVRKNKRDLRLKCLKFLNLTDSPNLPMVSTPPADMDAPSTPLCTHMDAPRTLLCTAIRHVQLDLPLVLYKLVEQVSPGSQDSLAMTVLCQNGTVMSVSLQKTVDNEEERMLLDITVDEGQTILSSDNDVYKLDLGSVQSPVYFQSAAATEPADKPENDEPNIQDPTETNASAPELEENTAEPKEDLINNSLPTILLESTDTDELAKMLATGEIIQPSTDQATEESVLMESDVPMNSAEIQGSSTAVEMVGHDPGLQEIASGAEILDGTEAVDFESGGDLHHASEQEFQIEIQQGEEFPSIIVLNNNTDANNSEPATATAEPSDTNLTAEEQFIVQLTTDDGGQPGQGITEVLTVSGADWWQNPETIADAGADEAEGVTVAAESVSKVETVGRVNLMSSERSTAALSSGELELASSLPVHDAKDIPRILKDLSGLKCGLCSKVYSSKRMMSGHVQRSHPHTEYREEDMVPVLIKDAFLCYICHQPFRRFESVRKHLETFHQMATHRRTITRLVTCPLCQSRHSSYHTLRCHLSYKHGKDPGYGDALVSLQNQTYSQKAQRRQDCILLQCPWCPLQLTMKQFRHHVSTAHRDQDVVDTVIRDAKEAIRVQRCERIKQTVRTCKICQEALPLTRYYSHMRKVHQYSSKPLNVTCGQCGKTFASTWHLNAHSVVHKKERDFPCTRCSSAFRNKYALRTHINTVHLGIYPHSCVVCGRGFHTLKIKEGHKCDPTRKRRDKAVVRQQRATGTTNTTTDTTAADVLHNQDSAPLEGVGETGKEVSTIADNATPEPILERIVTTTDHETSTFVNQSDHLALLPSGSYSCLHCNKEFTTRGKVSTHLRRVHHISRKPITEHRCGVCQRTFILESKLRSHLVTHNEAMLKCSYCERSFKDKYTLKTHVRVVHERNYTLKCDKCGRGFEKSDNFYKHDCAVSNNRTRKTMHREAQVVDIVKEEIDSATEDSLPNVLPVVKVENLVQVSDAAVVATDSVIVIKTEPSSQDAVESSVSQSPRKKLANNKKSDPEIANITSSGKNSVKQIVNSNTKVNSTPNRTPKKRMNDSSTNRQGKLQKAAKLFVKSSETEQDPPSDESSIRSSRQRHRPSWLKGFQS